MIEYKVITKGDPTQLWASGFYGDGGREKAERMVADGYWHSFMYERDKHKVLEVVPARERVA